MKARKKRKIALVVDDDQLVCRSLRRLLRSEFDEVVTVTSPSDAQRVLRDTPVTHLVCDCNLGEGLPFGFTFVPGWLEICPTIERTVIFSGTDLSEETIPREVDAVLGKDAERGALIRAVLGTQGHIPRS